MELVEAAKMLSTPALISVTLLKVCSKENCATKTEEVSTPQRKQLHITLSRARIHNCVLFRPHEIFFVDIQIQKKASNFKVSTNSLKPDGTIKIFKEPIGDEIGDGECIKKSFRKIVKPCQKNFWSIGIQGRLFNPNAENDFVFKDKDCRFFETTQLPLAKLDTPPTPAPNKTPTPCPSKGKGKPCKKERDKGRVLYNNNRGKRGEKRSVGGV